uniref:C3H1-type domain-containing protein n=1 Tax=Panagrellus redivivus TaxID=6233 RepID=A0A7E4VH09_PANRE
MSVPARCPLYPGYCPYSAAECEFTHPSQPCPTSSCNDEGCPYVHRICELDAIQQVCSAPNCFDAHPFRASQNLPHSRNLNVMRGDDINYNPQTASRPWPSTNGITHSGSKRQLTSDDDVRHIERIHDRIYRKGLTIDFSPFFTRGKCMVCWKRVADNLIVPCNHLVLCGHCTNFSNRCVLCYEGFNNVFSFADPPSRY